MALEMHNLKMQDLKKMDQIAQQKRWFSSMHLKGGTMTFLYIVNTVLIFCYTVITVRVMFRVSVRIRVSIT